MVFKVKYQEPQTYASRQKRYRDRINQQAAAYPSLVAAIHKALYEPNPANVRMILAAALTGLPDDRPGWELELEAIRERQQAAD